MKHPKDIKYITNQRKVPSACSLWKYLLFLRCLSYHSKDQIKPVEYFKYEYVSGIRN